MLRPNGPGHHSLQRLRIGHALTTLALDCGDVVAARTIRDSIRLQDKRGDLLDAEIALAAGDLETAARLVPDEIDGFGAGERLRVHAIRLGLARRNDDRVTLTALWQRGLTLLAATEIDLYSLRALSEFWVAAARLADQSAVIRHVLAADRLLSALDEPASWTAAWQFAGVQAGIVARDDRLTAERLRRLEHVTARTGVGLALSRAARTWAVLALGRGVVDEGDAVAPDVEDAVVSLRERGLHWEAGRVAASAALHADDVPTAVGLLHAAREGVEADGASSKPVGGVLTEREADVAHELLQGYTYREIGERLYISPKTVEHHVARIRRRLDAGSRSQLLAALRAAGYS